MISLICLLLVCHWCMKSHHDTHNQISKKDMAFTFKRNFKFDIHWDRDKIMSWYYVMILWVIQSLYFGPCENSYRTMWYKITQNFNSLRYSVLEISAVQFGACHGFRAGASVHKLFVGGVSRTRATLIMNYPIFRMLHRCIYAVWHTLSIWLPIVILYKGKLKKKHPSYVF